MPSLRSHSYTVRYKSTNYPFELAWSALKVRAFTNDLIYSAVKLVTTHPIHKSVLITASRSGYRLTTTYNSFRWPINYFVSSLRKTFLFLTKRLECVGPRGLWPSARHGTEPRGALVKLPSECHLAASFLVPIYKRELNDIFF